MRDYNALTYDDLSQEEAHDMASDIIDHLDPSTIEGKSMKIDYRVLKKKMEEDPEEVFGEYEMVKLVSLYKHWLRQARQN